MVVAASWPRLRSQSAGSRHPAALKPHASVRAVSCRGGIAPCRLMRTEAPDLRSQAIFCLIRLGNPCIQFAFKTEGAMTPEPKRLVAYNRYEGVLGSFRAVLTKR